MPPGFLAKADEILTSAYPIGGPGAAAIITKEGRPVYRRATGLADLEFSTMLEPDMVFRIGSVTKQFTAAAVLLLADRGALNLDDDITKYVPDFDTGGRHVTVEHLLTHTSGHQELHRRRGLETDVGAGSDSIATRRVREARYVRIRARCPMGCTAIPATSCSG